MFARGFLGVVPTRLIETIVDICAPQDWSAVHVACSGTFRTERGLLGRFPDLAVHSNDVSLLSTALGHAGLGKALPFKFVGELDFIEELELTNPTDRVAAILLALSYSSFVRGKTNRFKESHRDHMRLNFGAMVRDNVEHCVQKVVDAMPISSYFGGDFRDHIERAIETGAGVIAYPPTFALGYERMFQFVHDNVEWDPPPYKIFDPKVDVKPVLQRLHESGIPYFLYLDQEVEGFTPQVRFEAKGARPIFGYGRARASSFRTSTSNAKPFAYTPIDLAKVHKGSKLTAVPVSETHISFLREAFLKKTIAFGTGDHGVLLFIDDMLIGCVSYRKPLSAGQPLYVLTDLAITREGRLAKLIARAATLRALIRPFERKLIVRFPGLRTTAYSDHPEAMKYRGSWKAEKRTETNGKAGRYEINYASEIRDESLDDCFAWWWQRDGQREVGEARRRAQDAGSASGQAA